MIIWTRNLANILPVCANCGEWIAYTVNQRLVRGLDYYNRTVFEWVTNSLGSRAPCVQAVVMTVLWNNWAVVQHRLSVLRWASNSLPVLLVQAVNPEFKADPVVDIYLVASGADTQSAAMALAERLRDELPGVKLMTNHGGGNFKKQFARADKWGARVAVVLGESEVANGTAVVKDLRSGEQTAVAQDSVACALCTSDVKEGEGQRGNLRERKRPGRSG